MRQALAGMLWSKQFFFFDGDNWLEEHGSDPLPQRLRKRPGTGMVPHAEQATSSRCPTSGSIPGTRPGTSPSTRSPLSIVDLDFAKEQLKLMLREVYLHPNGQIPAYEWNFSDVNPPVHAWAAIFLYRTEQALRGKSDIDFLKAPSTSCC